MLYILKVLNNKDRAGVNIKVDTKWQHSVLCLNAIFRPYICVCVCVFYTSMLGFIANMMILSLQGKIPSEQKEFGASNTCLFSLLINEASNMCQS